MKIRCLVSFEGGALPSNSPIYIDKIYRLANKKKKGKIFSGLKILIFFSDNAINFI